MPNLKRDKRDTKQLIDRIREWITDVEEQIDDQDPENVVEVIKLIRKAEGAAYEAFVILE